jgi:hypothetical protein
MMKNLKITFKSSKLGRPPKKRVLAAVIKILSVLILGKDTGYLRLKTFITIHTIRSKEGRL